ncbi:MAG: hypothetical protein P8P48_04175 [Saprospiraceae bacterium]|nr:hypothetical protein [Saprospiraceae bacterium]
MKVLISYTISVLLLVSAVAHIISPEFYAELIPDFFPENLANILSAISEAAIGIALLTRKYRHLGGLGFSLLMIAFLPIHVWDLLREKSALGQFPIPEIRLLVQLLLIYTGWWLYNSKKAQG